MSRHAHNKLTTEQVKAYCSQVGITLMDPEYISNSHKHQWECGRCGKPVYQRLDKIKRAQGRLNCCSRVSETNVKKGHQIAERWGLIFKELTFKNSQIASEWECPVHGTFKYSLFAALHTKDCHPCSGCRNELNKQILSNELNNFYKIVPFITLIDSEYKGHRVSHKWKCNTHNYETTSNLRLLLKNKRLKCCRAKEFSGENHPLYNSHIEESQRIKKRHYGASSAWSKAVRTRDKWECVICGHNSKCVAHHLDSYMSHPDKRYDVDNGVTLCRPHHIEFHKLYGVKHTTKQDFEEYKSLKK